MSRYKGRLARFWNEKKPVLKFLGGFIGLMVLFYLFYYSFLYQNYLSTPIENFQARLGSVFLELIGYDISVQGDSISGKGFAVSIANGCDGLEPLAMFLSGILVFPMAFRYKWPGMLAGLLVLFILNLFRIAGLFLAGLHWPEAFDFLHLHGGFVIFTLISILLWMVWANWALRKKQAAQQQAAA